MTFRNARLLTLSVLLALASMSFFMLPSYSAIHSNEQEQGASVPNWTKRKISSASVGRSASLSHKSDIFLKTGKAAIKFDAGMLPKASNGLPGPRVGASKRRKQNRLVRGTHLSLAEMNGWPPMDELIGRDGKVAAHEDISWLLDFSIIGFAKTGTTSMLRHLAQITHMPPSETCDLSDSGAAKLVKDLYADRNKRLEVAERHGEEFEEQLRGIKCPQDISSDAAMQNYAKYFPNTKLVVGVRHPVLWFESLYNFRVSNVPWKKMLHTNLLTRGCTFGSQGVCAQRASFADFLSQLGKTRLDTPKELDLLSMGLNPVKSSVGKVFLYDLSQLSESEDGRIQSTRFREDLKAFLGLTVDIPPFPVIDTSGRFDFLEPIKQQTDANKIDICDNEHARIHQVLMEKARTSSVWIRDYFLESSDVIVSNRSHFLELIERWNEDPCVERRNTK
ncbi:hypothetical protein ACHAWO_001882 [Cyclotella atomus]|uniref:Sulfotransferase domain-containing protein n=1 Tax=Cyclotella atomus TaxID=382360 RepID=A0ABD3N2S8_9STRA